MSIAFFLPELQASLLPTMPAYAGADPNHHDSYHSLLAQNDVFADEQQARQDQLDALLNNLAPHTDLEALQSFLASDAAKQDKIEQLVNFLAVGPSQQLHDELLADTDVFADEKAQRQKKLDELVDSLSTTTTAPAAMATAMLATDAGDVDVANVQPSFLHMIGGAVVLLVAVVLTVVTKRSRSKQEAEDDRKDFSYNILYE
ncbi:hypothetical protein V7S43_014124 [Phytophthora oleae]|uniref:Uncharacterized protein n=1 Tax=Phytophthora oleae TaxID=2107226 RepID=A0ABD3F2T3_9STRA